MTRYAGRQAVAYIGNAGGAAAGGIVGLSKWSLDQTTEKIEVTAFGDPNKEYVIGLADIKLALSGFWDDAASDTLFQASASNAAVNVYLYPTSLRTNKYWYGTGLAGCDHRSRRQGRREDLRQRCRWWRMGQVLG